MSVTSTAYQKYIRQSPRKLRLVADMVRNSKVNKAITQLEFASQTAAKTILKVLTQAQKNAINNQNAKPESLKITEIQIEEGPTFKRWRPVSRGRAHSIFKRSSHIKIVVSGEAPEAVKETKKAASKEK